MLGAADLGTGSMRVPFLTDSHYLRASAYENAHPRWMADWTQGAADVRSSSVHGRAGRHVPGTNVSTSFMLRCSFLAMGVGIRPGTNVLPLACRICHASSSYQTPPTICFPPEVANRASRVIHIPYDPSKGASVRTRGKMHLRTRPDTLRRRACQKES